MYIWVSTSVTFACGFVCICMSLCLCLLKREKEDGEEHARVAREEESNQNVLFGKKMNAKK